jgi:hypothetical protein
MWTAYIVVLGLTGPAYIATRQADSPAACIAAIKSYSQPETIIVASGCIADNHRPQPERRPAKDRT